MANVHVRVCIFANSLHRISLFALTSSVPRMGRGLLYIGAERERCPVRAVCVFASAALRRPGCCIGAAGDARRDACQHIVNIHSDGARRRGDVGTEL